DYYCSSYTGSNTWMF
nr:immunoglobulin light chain junction region [Macaca mulatta]